MKSMMAFHNPLKQLMTRKNAWMAILIFLTLSSLRTHHQLINHNNGLSSSSMSAENYALYFIPASSRESKPRESDYVYPYPGRKPYQQLSPVNLEYVLSAEPVPLKYEDVTGIPDVSQRKPLHFGARDPITGEYGYIHNDTALRLNPPPLHLTKNQIKEHCEKHDDDFFLLTQKVQVVSENDILEQRQRLQRAGIIHARHERLLCMIYTTTNGHTQVKRIRETWAPKCDGFMIASNVTIPELNTVDIGHKFNEAYKNMWQKIRTIWSYVYDHYYDDYDWFHIGGDDLYVIVENLRYYLESEEIKVAANGGKLLPFGNETVQIPLYLGCRQRHFGNKSNIYHQGGSGYTLNKAALKLLVVTALPLLYVDSQASVEDVLIARLFKKRKVYPYVTRDTETGAERYNPLSPGMIMRFRRRGKELKWFKKWTDNPLLEGMNYSATHSVSFHYVRDDETYRVHSLLNGLCPPKSLVVLPGEQPSEPELLPPSAKGGTKGTSKNGVTATNSDSTDKTSIESDSNSLTFVNSFSTGNKSSEYYNYVYPYPDRKPYQKLSPVNLAYVLKVKPVPLKYQDVTGSRNISQRKPLHFGARDPITGNYGYIHNTTALRLKPPPLNLSTKQIKGYCKKHDDDFFLLTQKVKVVSENDILEQRRRLQKAGVLYARHERLLCMIYTTTNGHEQVQRISETWAPKCDGFMVASNVTIPEFNTVEIVHKFNETYQNMWQKIRTMWSYVYDNYYEDYDWFHIGGDDLYVIVENLRYYLESEEIKVAANGGKLLPFGNETKQTPLYLGCRQRRKGKESDIYHQGGSGYTLNKAALKLLVVTALPLFYVDTQTSAEDVLIARLLRKRRVYPYVTRDVTGAERYNPLSPGMHMRFRMQGQEIKWFKTFTDNPLLEGMDYSATHSVAFHYVRDDETYRVHSLLNGLCPPKTLIVLPGEQPSEPELLPPNATTAINDNATNTGTTGTEKKQKQSGEAKKIGNLVNESFKTQKTLNKAASAVVSETVSSALQKLSDKNKQEKLKNNLQEAKKPKQPESKVATTTAIGSATYGTTTTNGAVAATAASSKEYTNLTTSKIRSQPWPSSPLKMDSANRRNTMSMESDHVYPYPDRKPYQKLSPVNLGYVLRVKPVPLKYQDVTGGPKLSQRKPLHFGARDPITGSYGYVHNDTALRLNPPPLNLTKKQVKGYCKKHDDEFFLLTQKVKVVSETDILEQRRRLQKAGVVHARHERLFCLIYTSSNGHKRVQRIRETWAPKCDGFMVASNVTIPELNTVDIEHKFNETYQNMWQKIRTMWSYVYDHYYEDYDWFHIGGDDLYIIVENLRYYLESEEIKVAANGGTLLPFGNETTQTPLYLGCRQRRKGKRNDIYHGGGPGYTLNKAALKLLVVTALPLFYVDTQTSAEDVLIARLLRKRKVYPYVTREAGTGAERYNPLSPRMHMRFRMQGNEIVWFKRWTDNPHVEGMNYSATHSVVFHYIRNDMMYRVHSLLNGLCPQKTLVILPGEQPSEPELLSPNATAIHGTAANNGNTGTTEKEHKQSGEAKKIGTFASESFKKHKSLNKTASAVVTKTVSSALQKWFDKNKQERQQKKLKKAKKPKQPESKVVTTTAIVNYPYRNSDERTPLFESLKEAKKKREAAIRKNQTSGKGYDDDDDNIIIENKTVTISDRSLVNSLEIPNM